MAGGPDARRASANRNGESATVTSPADPTRARRHGAATPPAEDVRSAIDAADDGFTDWSATPAAERAAILRRRRTSTRTNTAESDAIATREAGKTLPDGIAEVREAVDFLRYYANEAERLEAEADRAAAAASSSASARGTSRWRSSPVRSRRRWPPAMRCWPNRPSRPR